MTIGIERTPGGRLWACWVAGGDSPKAFFVLANSDNERPIISTTIDFLDYCFFRTDPSTGYFTEEQYNEVIRTVAEAGITKIYLRVDVCGLTLYPTKVGRQYAGDGRDV